MNKLSLLQAAELLHKGEVSSLELTQMCLKNIAASSTNSVLALAESQALESAKNADNLLQKLRSKSGFASTNSAKNALLGIPVLIKDNIDVAGLPTTCGSLALKNNIAKTDAVSVQKLRQAGAIILGKLNMDEFAMGSSNMTSAFGRVLNPLDFSRVSGGSSGGSAAAVAEGLCFAALGSDTGGSIRQPAAYCGVVGLKPTFGSISSDGCFPLAPSMDMVGPLAKTTADTAAVFSALVGESFFAGRDGVSGLSDFSAGNFRIGVINQASDLATGSAKTVVDDALRLLSNAGCTVVNLCVPDFSAAAYIYKSLAFAEIACSLSGVTEHRELFGFEVKKRIIAGRFMLENPALRAKAQVVRDRLTQQMLAATAEVDAIILPTAPSAAFSSMDSEQLFKVKNSDIFLQPASISGLPSLSLPFGTEDGMPTGLQIVAKKGGESVIFALAEHIERLLA